MLPQDDQNAALADLSVVKLAHFVVNISQTVSQLFVSLRRAIAGQNLLSHMYHLAFIQVLKFYQKARAICQDT